jgi:hypothetical protein
MKGYKPLPGKKNTGSKKVMAKKPGKKPATPFKPTTRPKPRG